MNNAIIGKVAGWAQFGFAALTQLGTVGVPTSPMGWMSWIGSLAMAIGVHAASSTDGAK